MGCSSRVYRAQSTRFTDKKALAVETKMEPTLVCSDNEYQWNGFEENVEKHTYTISTRKQILKIPVFVLFWWILTLLYSRFSSKKKLTFTINQCKLLIYDCLTAVKLLHPYKYSLKQKVGLNFLEKIFLYLLTEIYKDTVCYLFVYLYLS